MYSAGCVSTRGGADSKIQMRDTCERIRGRLGKTAQVLALVYTNWRKANEPIGEKRGTKCYQLYTHVHDEVHYIFELKQISSEAYRFRRCRPISSIIYRNVGGNVDMETSSMRIKMSHFSGKNGVSKALKNSHISVAIAFRKSTWTSYILVQLILALESQIFLIMNVNLDNTSRS